MKETFPNWTTFGIPDGIAKIPNVAGLKKITPARSLGTGWVHAFRAFSIAAIVNAGAKFSLVPADTDGRFHYVLVNTGEDNIPLCRLEQTLALSSESWMVLPPGGHTDFDLSKNSQLILLAIDKAQFRHREIEIIAGAIADGKEARLNRFFIDAVKNVAASHEEIIVDQGSMLIFLMASLRQSKPYRDAVFASDTPASLYYAALDAVGELLYIRDLDSKMIGELFGVTDKVLNDVFASANTTVKKQILMARLLRAKEYLSDPNNDGRSIELIAHDVGIDSISYFSTQYKKFFGHPPSEDFNSQANPVRVRNPMMNIKMFTHLLFTNKRIRELALAEKHPIPYSVFEAGV